MDFVVWSYGLDTINSNIKNFQALNPDITINLKDYSWLAILCDDPSVKGGDYHKVPTAAFLPDVGIAVVRDSWQDDGVGARFKCGPLGGYRSNAWCKSPDANKRTRPNVAHDHPDAGSFTLFAQGEYLAETDRYPIGKGVGKLSTGHNTILINGVGQAPQGRAEGEDWMQPGTGDLTEAARMVAGLRGKVDAVMGEVPCGECGGSRLADAASAVTLWGRSLDVWCRMPLGRLQKEIAGVALSDPDKKIAGDLLRELTARVAFLVDVGLEYLDMARTAGSLSGGPKLTASAQLKPVLKPAW
jgi:hypothetical protein